MACRTQDRGGLKTQVWKFSFWTRQRC